MYFDVDIITQVIRIKFFKYISKTFEFDQFDSF